MRGGGMKKYVYKKNALPRVVLSEHAALTALFDYAFETAFRKVDYIEKTGWKPRGKYGFRDGRTPLPFLLSQ